MQLEDKLQESTRQERQNFAVDGVSDGELFYIDKVQPRSFVSQYI